MPGNTPWSGSQSNKLYLQSGEFSATLKTSLSVGAVDSETTGIAWDGTNTPWTGATSDKLYLQSGQFSATMKTSRSVGGVDNVTTGIENTTRLAAAGPSTAQIMAVRFQTSTGGMIGRQDI